MKVGPHVGVALAASFANETRLDIREANAIAPSVAADGIEWLHL